MTPASGGFTPPPYLPPAPGLELPGTGQPAALPWLRGFCAAQLLMFGGMTLVGLGLVATAAVDPSMRAAPHEPPFWVIGAFVLVLCAPLSVFYLVGVVAPRRPWLYVYGFVTFGVAFLCGGCWFLAIPVLIQWVKPETRAWLEQRSG